MARSPRWRRNRRLKCECGGYWFPHRRGGGLCHHSRSRALLLAKLSGCAEAIAEATVDYLFDTPPKPTHGECPF